MSAFSRLGLRIIVACVNLKIVKGLLVAIKGVRVRNLFLLKEAVL